ncbi:MAG TPA: amino acid permease, partial [Rhizomicrobium sp.]
TLLTGIVVAAIAATLSLDQIAAVANAGTLCAFIAVAVCMLIMRVRDPNRVRVFRVPLPWVVGPVCIVGCLFLFVIGLSTFTKWCFVIWNAAGLLVYFAYSMRASKLANVK